MSTWHVIRHLVERNLAALAQLLRQEFLRADQRGHWLGSHRRTYQATTQAVPDVGGESSITIELA